MTEWLQFKSQIVAAIGLDRDALHIYVSVLIQFAVALGLRRGLDNWLPWFTALAAACVNELLDLGVEIWPEPAMQAGQAAHDIVNSMILPTMLLVAVRWSPATFLGRSDP